MDLNNHTKSNLLRICKNYRDALINIREICLDTPDYAEKEVLDGSINEILDTTEEHI